MDIVDVINTNGYKKVKVEYDNSDFKLFFIKDTNEIKFLSNKDFSIISFNCDKVNYISQIKENEFIVCKKIKNSIGSFEHIALINNTIKLKYYTICKLDKKNLDRHYKRISNDIFVFKNAENNTIIYNSSTYKNINLYKTNVSNRVILEKGNRVVDCQRIIKRYNTLEKFEFKFDLDSLKYYGSVYNENRGLYFSVMNEKDVSPKIKESIKLDYDLLVEMSYDEFLRRCYMEKNNSKDIKRKVLV